MQLKGSVAIKKEMAMNKSSGPRTATTKNIVGIAFGLLWRTYLVFFVVAYCVWISLTILNGGSFVKLKPTIGYLSVAIVMFASSVVFRRYILKSVMGGRLSISDLAWKSYQNGLVRVLLFLALLNAFVAFTFTTATWVDYRNTLDPLLFWIASTILAIRTALMQK